MTSPDIGSSSSSSLNISSSFNITEHHTEQQLIDAGYEATGTEGATQYARWRFISQAFANTREYFTNLIYSTPKINASIKKMDVLIQHELAHQNLETADLKTLNEYEKRCYNILSNIQTHENMVKKFAEKHLFLKDRSPVLTSHIKEKEKVLEHISKIAASKIALEKKIELEKAINQFLFHEEDEKKALPVSKENISISLEPVQRGTVVVPKEPVTPEMVNDLKQKIIEKQVADLSKVDQNVLKELYDQTNISPNDTPEFPTFFRLHLILHDSSPTYKDIMAKIRNESKKTRPNLPENTPITILRYDESKFDACWFNKKNAVCINMKQNTMDTDEGLGMIGSLIAFEATNAFQEATFARIHKEAVNGDYELSSILLGVDLYVTDMEEVEQYGISIQSRIIAEAMQNNPRIVNNSWNRYANYRAKRGIGCFLDSHGENYREHYVTKIRPEADKKLKEKFKTDKSKYAAHMFQLEMRRRLES